MYSHTGEPMKIPGPSTVASAQVSCMVREDGGRTPLLKAYPPSSQFMLPTEMKKAVSSSSARTPHLQGAHPQMWAFTSGWCTEVRGHPTQFLGSLLVTIL